MVFWEGFFFIGIHPLPRVEKFFGYAFDEEIFERGQGFFFFICFERDPGLERIINLLKDHFYVDNCLFQTLEFYLYCLDFWNFKLQK